MAVAVEAPSFPAGRGARWKWPLLRAGLGQELMAETGEVAETAGGEGHEFGVHIGRGGCGGEEVPMAEAAAQFGEHLPVGPGLTRGWPEGRTEGDPPLGVGHRALLLTPLGRGQHQMGGGGGLTAGIGLAQHHKGTTRQGGPHPGQIRQADQGIGGCHPPEVEGAGLHRLDLLPYRQARAGSDRPRRQPPGLLHFGPVAGITHRAVAGQELGQPTGLPTAHGIRLAGKGEGPGTGPADLTAEQVEVDQPADRGGAFSALIQPHRPEAEHGRRARPDLGKGMQLLLGDPADGGGALRSPGLHMGREGLKPLGGRLHEGPIEGTGAQQQMRNTVQQGQIRAGSDRQVEVGGGGGRGGAGVDHHDAHGAGIPLAALQQPLEEHRMAVGGIGADQEHAIGQVEVVVAAGRAIGAEAAAIGGDGRTHAQPGIGVEVVGAQGALEQLLGDVVILREKLTAAVHGDRPGTLAGQGRLDALYQHVEGLVPADPLKGLIAAGAIEGVGEAARIEAFAHRGALHAHLAEAGGMEAIAAGLPGGGWGGLAAGTRGCSSCTGAGRQHLQPATHAAIGALTANRLGAGGRVGGHGGSGLGSDQERRAGIVIAAPPWGPSGCNRYGLPGPRSQRS